MIFMAEINRAIKGTNDILPGRVHIWQYLEEEIRKMERGDHE